MLHPGNAAQVLSNGHSTPVPHFAQSSRRAGHAVYQPGSNPAPRFVTGNRRTPITSRFRYTIALRTSPYPAETPQKYRARRCIPITPFAKPNTTKTNAFTSVPSRLPARQDRHANQLAVWQMVRSALEGTVTPAALSRLFSIDARAPGCPYDLLQFHCGRFPSAQCQKVLKDFIVSVPRHTLTRSRAYRYCMCLGMVTVRWSPVYLSYPQTVVSFHPSVAKLTIPMIAAWMRFIFGPCACEAVLARYDVKVDVHEPPDVVARSVFILGVRSCKIDRGTVYAGSRRSNRQVAVYDKARESRQPGPLTRIEVRYRLKQGSRPTLRDLERGGFPFTKFPFTEVYRLDMSRADYRRYPWRIIRNRVLQDVLVSLRGPTKRARLIRALKRHSSAVWAAQVEASLRAWHAYRPWPRYRVVSRSSRVRDRRVRVTSCTGPAWSPAAWGIPGALHVPGAHTSLLT